MNKLINWLNNHIDPPKRKRKKYDLHPLLIAAGFHTQFIKIHPFGDGNGRMARILTNLILMVCGYVPAIIKLDRRKDYFTSINTSSLERPEDLATFLGEAVIETLELSINAAKGDSIENEDDIDKELDLLDKKLKAQELEAPIRNKGHIENILKLSAFPFFDKAIELFSKFDRFFEAIDKNIFVNSGAFVSTMEDRKSHILGMVEKEEPRDVYLQYQLVNLKNSTKEVGIGIKIQYKFLKGSYSITDSLTNKTTDLRYNQFNSDEYEKEWLSDIQKILLKKVKSLIEP